MNFFKRAYIDEHFTFSSKLDFDAQYNYMLQFCDVSHWSLPGKWWADLDSDGSFIFKNTFNFNRAGYKQLFIVANVLPAETGSIVKVEVKCNRFALLPITVIVIVIGLLLLWGSFFNGVLRSQNLPTILFFLIVLPFVLATATFYYKKFLIKRFVEQFDLIAG